jgi:hypothetical protein
MQSAPTKLWCQYNQFPTLLTGYVPGKTNDPQIDISIIKADDTQYYNIDKTKLRCKFVQLAATSLFTDTIGGVLVIGWELFHALTLGYLLPGSDRPWVDRIKPCILFLVAILRVPVLIVLLFALSIYGIAQPQRARLNYVHYEELLYGFTADTLELCGGYRPLYSFMALALHTKPTVDSYDIYFQERKLGYRYTDLEWLFIESPDNDK